MKLFDSHIHLFEKPYSDIFENTHIKNGEKGEFALYKDYKKKFNITGAFVIAYENEKWPNNNKFVANLAERNKWTYSFGHIRRDKGNFLLQAKRLIRMGHFGTSLYIDQNDKAAWLNSKDMDRYWRYLKENKIPMSINMKASQVKFLLKVLERYPDQVFLLSHMLRPKIIGNKFDKEAYRLVLRLKVFRNVYVKLSGFYGFVKDGWRYPQKSLFQAIDILKGNFGAEKLIWGSDFSPVLEFNTFRQSFEILHREYRGFSRPELEKVLYKNSLRIIKTFNRRLKNNGRINL